MSNRNPRPLDVLDAMFFKICIVLLGFLIGRATGKKKIWFPLVLLVGRAGGNFFKVWILLGSLIGRARFS